MKEIIRLRTDYAFWDGVVDDRVINYPADVATERGGDVRTARETLLKAGDMARKDRGYKVTADHIRRALSKSQFSKKRSHFEQLPSDEKRIISLIPEQEMSYPEFYHLYRKMYPNRLRDRMLRYHLERLRKRDLISMERKGTGGKYYISLRMPKKVLGR